MNLQPITHAEANAFVKLHHRHHKPTPGHVFSVAVSEDGKVCGVAIVGRPVARMLDNGWTLEVNRLCTDGTRNACSMLYQASWRAAKALGYRRLITYTLPAEGGASLRGANWKNLGETGGGNWNHPCRPRVNTDLILRGQKTLWEAPWKSFPAAQQSKNSEPTLAQVKQIGNAVPVNLATALATSLLAQISG